VPAPHALALRRGVLAVSVLHDLDIEPAPLGVTLTGTPAVWVSWAQCRRALAGQDPESEQGRERLAAWLLARRWAAQLVPDELRERLRPVGLPVEHALHPGLDWVRVRVLGGALDLGLGAVGLDPAAPDAVVLLPQPLLDGCGIDALAVERLRLDAKGQLRPLGDCDVVTLLGSTALRSAIASAAGGMGAAVVPMRRRGWTRLALIDPAFGAAAAAATAPAERGFPRPVLLTADEVVLVVQGGSPDVVLRSPATDAPWGKDVLYR